MSREGIVLLGAWGQGNLGDEAILEGMLWALRDYPVTVLSRGPVGPRAVLWKHPMQMLRVLGKSRVLLLGGGTLLQDQTSRRSLWFYVGVSALAKLLGSRVMVFAGGIGPLRHRTSRRLTRWFLERVADEIALRTHADGRALEELGVKKAFTVTSDAAFLAPFWSLQTPQTESLDAGKQVFCPRFGEPVPPEVLQDPSLWTVLPLGKNDAKTRLKGASYASVTTPLEAWNTLQQAQKVVSQRLHGLILSFGKNAKATTSDPKIQGFLPEMEYSLNNHIERAKKNTEIAINLYKK